MRNERIDRSRRGFLRGAITRKKLTDGFPPPRMPWIDQDAFHDACTRCGACEKACPEQIITKGDGGFPDIDFRLGECTFCGQCRDICEEPVFKADVQSPWQFIALIGDNCLAKNGVSCQNCRDSCDARAIRFLPQLGGAAIPVLTAEDCTGCGACVLPCPVDAISIGEQAHESISAKPAAPNLNEAPYA